MVSGPGSGSLIWAKVSRVMYRRQTAYSSDCSARMAPTRRVTKRLIDHARPSDLTEGYAADWTIEQLREPAQRIADRIEGLMMSRPEPASPAA